MQASVDLDILRVFPSGDSAAIYFSIEQGDKAAAQCLGYGHVAVRAALCPHWAQPWIVTIIM